MNRALEIKILSHCAATNGMDTFLLKAVEGGIMSIRASSSTVKGSTDASSRLSQAYRIPRCSYLSIKDEVLNYHSLPHLYPAILCLHISNPGVG